MFLLKNKNVIYLICIYFDLLLTFEIKMSSRQFDVERQKAIIIKNYLSNSMGQNQLCSIAVLNIERNWTTKKNISRLINSFINIKSRKY